MNDAAATTYKDFTLPPSVVTKVDVSRLVSEVERVDNTLTTAAIQAQVGASQSTPQMSGQLAEFLSQNKIDLNDNHARSDIIAKLRELKDNVPVVHMTFAVAADPQSLQELITWLRTSVHPQAVISVGLQPALVAGVYLRTPNRVLDLSLRAMLAGGHGILVKELEALRGSS